MRSSTYRIRGLGIFLALLAIVLAATPAAAEFAPTLGVKAGIGWAKMDGGYMDAGGLWRTGFVGGAYVGLGVAKGLEVQPHVLYAQRGGKDEQLATDEQGREAGIFETVYKFDYIEVPLLVRWSIPVTGRVAPALFVGPQISLEVSSKFRLDGDLPQNTPTGDRDVENTNGTLWSIVAGAGVDFGVGDRNLTLDVLYGHGLSSVISGPLGDIKNRSWTILAGIEF